MQSSGPWLASKVSLVGAPEGHDTRGGGPGVSHPTGVHYSAQDARWRSLGQSGRLSLRPPESLYRPPPSLSVRFFETGSWPLSRLGRFQEGSVLWPREGLVGRPRVPCRPDNRTALWTMVGRTTDHDRRTPPWGLPCSRHGELRATDSTPGIGRAKDLKPAAGPGHPPGLRVEGGLAAGRQGFRPANRRPGRSSEADEQVSPLSSHLSSDGPAIASFI